MKVSNAIDFFLNYQTMNLKKNTIKSHARSFTGGHDLALFIV